MHDIAADPDDGTDGAAEGSTPFLALGGFSGPLDRLLILARAQQADLAKISLTALVDQLAAALRQAPAAIPLGEKANWVVMAAWLVQLRARLLLPADAPAAQQAAAAAGALRERLAALQQMQALALWLERRPQLGRDVFVRGQPESFGYSVAAGQAIDVIEFLWASLALFDDETDAPDTAAVYRPVPLDLHTVADARERILRLLGENPDGAPFERLLPAPSETADSGLRRTPRRRSAWSSTLMAGLELVRQGAVVTIQEADFQAIHVALT
jgi:segregation and condensation protein A